MNLQSITREQVIELVQTMPMEKLAVWYEYGLFVQSRPLISSPYTQNENDDSLEEEFKEWEAASDEDWLGFEEKLTETG